MNAVKTPDGYITTKEIYRYYLPAPIPIGYEYDGATYPKWITWLKVLVLIFAPKLDLTDAVIIHDWLYQHRNKHKYSRYYVDNVVFYNELKRYYWSWVANVISSVTYKFSKQIWLT
jgi:hypothetical protein